MSEKRILIQEYDENPCLSCTNDCKYPCEAKRESIPISKCKFKLSRVNAEVDL